MMFRLSPPRSQRSKGFKVKHALQLSLLLGISWMLYQLKHTQDKKTTLGEASVSVQNVFKLGRKYLHPQKDETSIVDARLEEDEVDEETTNEVLNRPNDMNDSNTGKGEEADDILAREHEQDKDKDTVDQEREAQVRDERADPVKENEQEDNLDNVNILVDGESKEDEKRVSGKIEVNESERAEDIENVSRVNRSKESQESVRREGKENENENAQIKETGKEDEENVEKVQDGGEAKDGAEGSQEQEQNREKEEEERMEDLITANYHVQDGSDRKDEEARQEYKTIDNSSIVVLNQIQHVPDGKSTVNITNDTEVVDDAPNKNGANVEDGSKNEEKTVDASQTSRVTESHYRLQEKDNSITFSEGTSNPSVQDGTESVYNTVEKQDEITHHKNSGGDNNNLRNIVVHQTLESGLAASSEQSDSGSTSGATDADAATGGEFKDTTTHLELHDNTTQTNKSSEDESYSAMRGNSESSDGEKSNKNPTAEGTQESIVLSDTNGNVHEEKDEHVTSSDTSLDSERGGLSTSDNNSSTGQSESDELVQKNGTDNASTEDNHEAGETGRVNASDGSSTENTDDNFVIRMSDENGNTGQNESFNYQQENEESSQAK